MQFFHLKIKWEILSSPKQITFLCSGILVLGFQKLGSEFSYILICEILTYYKHIPSESLVKYFLIMPMLGSYSMLQFTAITKKNKSDEVWIYAYKIQD